MAERSTGGDDGGDEEQEQESCYPAENSANSPEDYMSEDNSTEFGPEHFYTIEQLVLSKNKHNASGLHLASIKGSVLVLSCVAVVKYLWY